MIFFLQAEGNAREGKTPWEERCIRRAQEQEQGPSTQWRPHFIWHQRPQPRSKGPGRPCWWQEGQTKQTEGIDTCLQRQRSWRTLKTVRDFLIHKSLFSLYCLPHTLLTTCATVVFFFLLLFCKTFLFCPCRSRETSVYHSEGEYYERQPKQALYNLRYILTSRGKYIFFVCLFVF